MTLTVVYSCGTVEDSHLIPLFIIYDEPNAPAKVTQNFGYAKKMRMFFHF
jgi:hypothetical protein